MTGQFFSRNQELVLMITFLAMVFGTSLPAPCSPSRISVCGPGTLTPTSMASHLTRAYGAAGSVSTTCLPLVPQITLAASQFLPAQTRLLSLSDVPAAFSHLDPA